MNYYPGVLFFMSMSAHRSPKTRKHLNTFKIVYSDANR